MFPPCFDIVSEAQCQLARRAASLSVQAELAEMELVRGGQLELESYIKLVNALNRTLGNLGIERRVREKVFDWDAEFERLRAADDNTNELPI